MSSKLFTLVSDANNPTTLRRMAIMPAQVVEFESGLEQRNKVWTVPRFRFDLGWEFPLDDTTVNSILGFNIEHGGNYEAFLFQPALIDTGAAALSGQVLGKGNGAQVVYKTYGNRYASAQVYVDGSSVTATYSTGGATITLAVAPTSGQLVTANVTSERFVVRFDESQINHEFFLWKLTKGFQVTLVQEKGTL